MSTKRIVRIATISTIYVVLSLIMQPLAYGPIQFRISEAMTILPIFMIEAVPSLAIGCLITNMLSIYSIYDMIIGTFATLLAAILTYIFKRRIIIAGIFPVLTNALLIPIIFILSGAEESYLYYTGTIALSQFIIIYAIAIPLVYYMKKRHPILIDKLTSKGEHYLE